MYGDLSPPHDTHDPPKKLTRSLGETNTLFVVPDVKCCGYSGLADDFGLAELADSLLI